MRPVDLALTRWAVSRLDGFLVPAASLSAWQGGAFLWSTNRLMPAQTARTYSEHLLGRFRDICEDLELADLYRQSDETETDLDDASVPSEAAPVGSRPHASVKQAAALPLASADEAWVPEI